MQKSFEFNYCLDSVESIDSTKNITQKQAEEIVKKLIKSDEIYVGERTTGIVTFNDNTYPIIYNVNYQYCQEIGDDWQNDVWVEHETKVQL